MSTFVVPSGTGKKPPRTFPFKAGTGYKPADWDLALGALKTFGVLWNHVKNGDLVERDISHVFKNSTSDLISYRDSWKCGKFWSVSAWETACANGNTNGLLAEHVLPRGETLKHALSFHNVEDAKRFVWENSFVCVVTKAEDDILTSAGFRSMGDVANPWTRYAAVKGLYILDVIHDGHSFLSDSEREPLKALDLLRGMSALSQECAAAPLLP
jgi:hypothetical protein